MWKAVIVLCAILFVATANVSSRSAALENAQREAKELIDNLIFNATSILNFTKLDINRRNEIILNNIYDFGNATLKEIEEIRENVTREISNLADGYIDASKCIELSNVLRDTAETVISNTIECVNRKLAIKLTQHNLIDNISISEREELINFKENVNHCGRNVDGQLSSEDEAIACVRKVEGDASHFYLWFLYNVRSAISNSDRLMRYHSIIFDCARMNNLNVLSLKSKETKHCVGTLTSSANLPNQ